MRAAITTLLLAIIITGCSGPSFSTPAEDSPPPASSSNYARELFGKMEQKVKSLKTLQFQYLGVWREERAEGKVVLAEKERFLCEMRIAGSGGRVLVRDYGSDGNTLRIYYKGGTDSRKVAPKGVRDNVGSVFLYTLPSWVDPWMFVEDGVAIASQGTLSEFQFLKTTRLSGRECHEIEYVRGPLMFFGESRPKYRVRLWMDSRTYLPVRRVTSRIGETSDVPYVETFEGFKLNERIDSEVFRLPEKQ